jgi:hypothetical protein
MNLLVALIVGLAALALVVGACYAIFVSPFVRWHFGEESRRDYEARRRRKEFERRCAQCLGAIYFSGVAGVMRGALAVLAPDSVAWTWALQIGVLVVAGLFAWAAVNRWREPFEN